VGDAAGGEADKSEHIVGNCYSNDRYGHPEYQTAIYYVPGIQNSKKPGISKK